MTDRNRSGGVASWARLALLMSGIVVVALVGGDHRSTPTRRCDVDALCGGSGPGCSHEPADRVCVEPHPMPYLRSRWLADDRLEVTLSPLANAFARLSIVEPLDLRWEDGSAIRELELRIGSPTRTFLLPAPRNARTTIRLQLFASHAREQFLSSIDHVVEFDEFDEGRGETPSAPAELERVPVAIPQPDGRAVVEYMTRADAARRDLPVLERRSR